MVNDFQATVARPVDAEPMNAYLLLGAYHSQAGNPARVDLGEDLATLVHGFTDDLRARNVGTPGSSGFQSAG
jgi:hypothetical protein